MRKLMEAVQLDEGATSKQWEIAVNNLIGEGDKLWRERDASEAQIAVWEWVSGELHGMLDFQPENDGGLGHENTLGNDSEPNFGGWPDEQR